LNPQWSVRSAAALVFIAVQPADTPVHAARLIDRLLGTESLPMTAAA
jgi:hypothetical protein